MSNMNKNKYKHYHNRKPNTSRLDVNLKGFLCSCNNREKDCIKEAYNILNKYADKLYPPKNDDTKNEEETIEDELKKELAELKSNAKHRFQVVDSGAKNFLFITTTLEDPVVLAEAIVAEIDATKEIQTKFLIRLVPIEVTCRAYVNDIEAAFSVLAEKYFKESPKSFSVIFNHRNNNSLDRDEVIKTVANIVLKLNSSNKVDLKTPDVSVIVEAIKGIALISVVPKYLYYKKYNLHAISGQEENATANVPAKDESNLEETVSDKNGQDEGESNVDETVSNKNDQKEEKSNLEDTVPDKN